METGKELVGRCKKHLLATMRKLPECAASGPGLRNKEIEKAADFSLDLPQQDGWLTWSLLMSLLEEGEVGVTRRGKRGVRYFRLNN